MLPSWRLVFISLCLTGTAVFLAAAPASAILALEERLLPFDLPLTHDHTDVRVVDAAAGTNGTAHLIVWDGIVDLHYLWVNTTTGALLDDGSILDPNEAPFCGSWACARVWAESGRVVVYRTVEDRLLHVRIFDEGQFATSTATSTPMPDPIGGDLSYDYPAHVLDLAQNASDPVRPSIIVVNAGFDSFPVPFQGTEAVLFPLDLVNRTLGALQRLGQVNGSFPGGATQNPLLWGSSAWWTSQSRFGCGVTLATGESWVFAHLATGWYAFGSASPPIPLFASGPAANRWVDCAVGPDGSAAALIAATNRTNTSNISMTWVRAEAGNASVLFWQNVTGGPMAFARAIGDPSGPALLLGHLRSDGQSFSTVLETYAGWPPSGSAQTVGTVAALLVAGFVLEGGAAPLLAVDAPRNPVNTSGPGAPGTFADTSFNGSWPALVRWSASGSAWTEVGDWKPLVAAPVRSVSIVSAANGAQIGGIVTRDNGTGRLHLLQADAGSAWFEVREGPALPGEAVTVQAVPFRTGALLVVQVAAKHPNDRGYGYPVWDTAWVSFLFFTVDAGGVASTPICNRLTPFSGCLGAGTQSVPAPWRLSSGDPFPLLSAPSGLYALDPANVTATLLQEGGQYLINYPAPMLRNLTKTDGSEYIPPLVQWPSTSDLSELPIEWWAEIGVTWAAYPLMTGQSPNAGMAFRVAQIGPGPALAWFDTKLSTGAANDSLSFTLAADVRTRGATGSQRDFTLVADQNHAWQRTFSLRFSTANLSFEEVRLVSETPSESLGYLVQVLAPWKGGVVHMRTREWEANGYTLGRVMTLEAVVFKGSGIEHIAMPPANYSCGWDRGGPAICPSWTPVNVGGDLGALVEFGGVVRFFGPNHLPTPPRLLAPENGTLLADANVLFKLEPSTDEDGDRLTYHFSIFDSSGTLVREGWTFDVNWPAALEDGDYRWTAEVGDGNAWVASPDVFVFTVDATPPRADAGGPYILSYGQSLRLNGSRSSDNRAVTSWQWAVGPPGATELTATGVAPDLPWPALLDLFLASGLSLSVGLTVMDEAGHTDVDFSVVTLNLTAPVVSPAILGTAFEGAGVDLGAEVTWEGADYPWLDPASSEGLLTFLWSFSDGTALSGPRVSYVPMDSGTVHVSVFVVPFLGPAGRAEFDLIVGNLAPVAVIFGPASLAEGETATYHAMIKDPSPVDNSSLVVEWSVSLGLTRISAVGNELRVTGASDGPRQITVVVRDKDGGNASVSMLVTVTETVLPVAGLRIVATSTSWVDLQWDPTEEEDFVAYEVTARFAGNGTPVGIPVEIKNKGEAHFRFNSLLASVEYNFTVVVIGKDGARSVPTSLLGSTATPPGSTPPPPDGNELPVNTGLNLGILVLILVAGGVALVVVLRTHRRRDE